MLRLFVVLFFVIVHSVVSNDLASADNHSQLSGKIETLWKLRYRIRRRLSGILFK
jgi:hypothetical protein